MSTVLEDVDPDVKARFLQSIEKLVNSTFGEWYAFVIILTECGVSHSESVLDGNLLPEDIPGVLRGAVRAMEQRLRDKVQ